MIGLKGDDVPPHSIVLDASGQVYVADRSNRRIQMFDGEGRFLRQFTIDVPLPSDARPAIGKMPDEATFAAGIFAPGSNWAICISLLGVLGRSGKSLKQFGSIHQMACPALDVRRRAAELAHPEARAPWLRGS